MVHAPITYILQSIVIFFLLWNTAIKESQAETPPCFFKQELQYTWTLGDKNGQIQKTERGCHRLVCQFYKNQRGNVRDSIHVCESAASFQKVVVRLPDGRTAIGSLADMFHSFNIHNGYEGNFVHASGEIRSILSDTIPHPDRNQHTALILLAKPPRKLPGYDSRCPDPQAHLEVWNDRTGTRLLSIVLNSTISIDLSERFKALKKGYPVRYILSTKLSCDYNEPVGDGKPVRAGYSIGFLTVKDTKV